MVAYVVLYAVCWPGYHRQINPDAVSYANHAVAWSTGGDCLQLSGYWSPLYPFLASLWLSGTSTPLEQLQALKLLTFAAGVVLSGFIGLVPHLPVVLRLSLACYLVAFSVLHTSPDVLFTAWLACFAFLFFRRVSPRNGFWLGLVGGCAGLTKAFGAPLLVAVLGLWGVLLYRRNQRLVPEIAIALLTMGGLWVGWVLLLHLETGHWVFSTAGGFNLALAQPQGPRYATFFEGFDLLPTPCMTSIWTVPDARVAEAVAATPLVWWQVGFNVLGGLVIQLSSLVFGLPVLIVALGPVLETLWQRTVTGATWLLLLAGGVYMLLLAPFPIETRYLLPLWVIVYIFFADCSRMLEPYRIAYTPYKSGRLTLWGLGLWGSLKRWSPRTKSTKKFLGLSENLPFVRLPDALPTPAYETSDVHDRDFSFRKSRSRPLQLAEAKYARREAQHEVVKFKPRRLIDELSRNLLTLSWFRFLMLGLLFVVPVYQLVNYWGIDGSTHALAETLQPELPRRNRWIASHNWAGAQHVAFLTQTQLCGIVSADTCQAPPMLASALPVVDAVLVFTVPGSMPVRGASTRYLEQYLEAHGWCPVHSHPEAVLWKPHTEAPNP